MHLIHSEAYVVYMLANMHAILCAQMHAHTCDIQQPTYCERGGMSLHLTSGQAQGLHTCTDQHPQIGR